MNCYLGNSIFWAVLFCLFLGGVQGQDLCFEYDAAGNQVKRLLCINDVSDKSALFSSDDLPEYRKFFSEDVISYYPNPVREELYLKWELSDDIVKKIEVYNLQGQVVDSYEDLSKENSLVVPFFTYPVGVYHVVFYYSSNRQKSIKVLKK
ncbi:MAG: T9SS type A sorting domain-containing protein [Bacteroidota bacterium]|nr:T9SS type A sorting domain-containing protein [Bacteroidota bacterium]